MVSQYRKRAEVLVARSKRTGVKYPVRMTRLAGAESSQQIEGERSGSLHYLSKDKEIVCRCRASRHFSCRQVRNPEIEELCDEFFLMSPLATTCSREQWRAIDAETADPMGASSSPGTENYRPASRLKSSRRDSFEYDSPSVVELLATRDRRSLDSGTTRIIQASHQRSPNSGSSSLVRVHIRHLNNRPYGEADVPEEMWRVSRPSVYLGQHHTGSFTSTPLGSSATPVQNGVYGKPATRTQAAETQTDYGRRYEFAQSPCATVLDSPYEMPHDSADRASQHSSRRPTSGFDLAGLQLSFSETLRPPVEGFIAAIGGSVHVAELPSSRTVVELDANPSHFPSHHSPTLRELEGRSVERVSEVAGRGITVWPTMSKEVRSPYRMSRLIDQPRFDASLPCQGEFLKWVEICSPSPDVNCLLCQDMLLTPDDTMIRLVCGHCVHHGCLLTD
jgi:hypothetical protein